jgi:biopolymer transport protein ExbD
MALGKLPEVEAEGEEAIFAEINITPLTDIFLVLLIIFMVSSTVAMEKAVEDVVKEKSSGLKVNLPSGESQEIDPARKSLVVTIPVTGDLVINGAKISDADLDNLFRSAFTRDKNTQVVLKADSGVNHGRVVNVMERAKRAGLSRLAIGTRGGP